MNIDKLLDKYNSVEELKIFCSAQMKQIQNLTNRNKELEEKLEKVNKELTAKRVESLPAQGPLGVSKEDAKVIAEIQLNMLKQVAFERELDTDEAKRVELYNRILKEDEAKKQPIKANVEVVSEAELLKLVE